jgi:membrane protein
MEHQSAERGRLASTPAEISGRGWWDIVRRVWKSIGSDHATLIAAGIALYALLAVFPALGVAVSLYGLFASPREVVEHMSTFANVLPPDAWKLLEARLQEIAQHEKQTLNVGIAVGLAVALWSARSGMSSLIMATNIAYKEEEKRGFFMQILMSLLFTLGAVLGFLLTLLLGVGVPLALSALGTNVVIQVIGEILRWPLLWAVAVTGLAVLYRFGPSREHARWRWVSWGSAIAATLWLIGSVLFTLYVRNAGNYGETYGALGGVIVLLMWFYISGFIVVLGAEINAEMERQTVRDTTAGPEKAMGQRGAYAADTLGESPATQ